MKKLTFLVVLLLSSLTFTARAATDWSTQDYDLYPGDFNGDGKTDLLYVAKDTIKQSGIALSDGTGPNIVLQSWALNYLGIPWGNNIYEPIVADFNGDGRADVFMQRNSPGDHYLLLSNPQGRLLGINQVVGNTTLGPALSADQHAIVAGDFSGDGKADLLLQATKPSLSNALVLADSSGTFTAAPAQSWNDGYLGFKWSAQHAFLYVGDVNGDGKKDLLLQARPTFIQIDSDGISIPIPFHPPNLNGVILSQGGGSPFQQAGVQAFSRNAFGADFSPLTSTVVVGDFNGDGRSDIVLQGRYSDRTSYLLNGNATGAIFSNASALANNVALSADRYRLVAGNFDGVGGAGLYLQTTSSGAANAYANTITGGSITTTTHGPPTSTGVVSSNTVGVTPGSFAIGNDGTANYSIPIVVPPGVAGVQPQLALTYSSQRGNGWLGVGWDISGLSQITRCRKTFAQDGVAEGVTLSMNDRFCLNGARLRKTSGTYGFGGSTYQLEVDTFLEITAYGSTGNGPTFFIARAKNGLIYQYGSSSDSRIESLADNSTPRVWALNRVQDRAGNIMFVSYTKDSGSFHPSEMLYTANATGNVSPAYKVKFVWESRPSADVLSGYFAGGLIKETARLNRIETQFAANPLVGDFRLVRKYQLSYNSGSTSRNRLAAVQECDGGGNCLAPTTISWQDGQSGWAAPVLMTLPNNTPADINGDGRTDVVRLNGSSLTYNLANASGGFDPQQQSSTSPYSFNGYVFVPFDYNGDGKTDILLSTGSPGGSTGQYFVAQSTGSGFTVIPTNIPYNFVQLPSPALLGDVNGDGRQDFIDLLAGAVRFNGPSGFGAPVAAFPAYSVVAGLGDFNGDGRTDLLVQNNQPAGVRLFLSQGTSFVNTGLLITTSAATAVGDINGDGIDDVTYKCASNRCLRFGGAGSLSVGLGDEVNTMQPALPTAFLADWDDDGKLDVLQGDGVLGSTNTLQLLRSTGDTLLAPVATDMPSTISGAFSDVNGDGLADFLYNVGVNVGTPNYASYAYLSLHKPGIPDLVTSIADGFGNATNVTYAPLTDASVYTKGGGTAFPQADVQQPMQVVKQYAQTDGTGSSYTVSATYSGARVDQAGRGFLGFSNRRLRDSRNNIYVKDSYYQDFPYTGIVFQQDVLQPDNATLISQVINFYSSTPLDTTANNQRYLVKNNGSVARRYEVGGLKNSALITEQTTEVVYEAMVSGLNC